MAKRRQTIPIAHADDVAPLWSALVDNQTLQSAKVSISSGFLTGDVLSANVAGTSITASYDPTTGVLTLTGNDTLVHYRQVLDSVTYNPTNFGADTSRTISWVGTLNSATQTTTLTILTTLTIPAQDAAPVPVLGNMTATIAFTNEQWQAIERAYTFAMHMQKLAMVATGSVTVLSHPSLQGMASGSGLSGSTAWHNAFRFRHYLKGVKPDADEPPDNDLRELEFLKNQYGSLGEKIALRYQNGLFLPEAGISSLDKAVREATVDEVFLRGLAQLIQQGRDAMAGTTSPEFGPTLIANLPEAKKQHIRKAELAEAMIRLLAAGKIHIGKTDGPASKAKKCLRPGAAS
jgi:hypothetical protein